MNDTTTISDEARKVLGSDDEIAHQIFDWEDKLCRFAPCVIEIDIDKKIDGYANLGDVIVIKIWVNPQDVEIVLQYVSDLSEIYNQKSCDHLVEFWIDVV